MAARLAGVLRERREGGLVQLGAGDDGRLLVEEVHEGAQDARLRLPAQAEEDQVVPGQDGVHEGGDDRPVVAEDPGEGVLPAGEHREEVLAHLVPHGAVAVAGFDELSEGRGSVRHLHRLRLHRRVGFPGWYVGRLEERRFPPPDQAGFRIPNFSSRYWSVR